MSERTVRRPEPRDSFGHLLRQRRALLKNNRNHISKKLGITTKFYAAIEKGSQFPTLPVFALLWQLIRFDANEVLDAIDVPIHEPAPADLPTPAPAAADVDGHYIAFGRLLAQAAIDAQMSRSKIAHAIGVTVQQVASDETGRTVPTVPRFAQLRRILGFDAGPMLAVLADPATVAPFVGFGHTLQTARIERGKSSSHVIQEMGCDAILYERIELGIELPTFAMMVQLHRVTRFDVGAALTWLWMNEPLTESVAPEPKTLKSSEDPAGPETATNDVYEVIGDERDPDIDEATDDEPDIDGPLDIDPARRDLALAIWPQRVIDAAMERYIEEIPLDPAFWQSVDEQLLQSMLNGDPELTHLGSYIRFSQDSEHRRTLIQVILGVHPNARKALDPSVLGALLDHGFAAVSAAFRSRLQEGDPALLDYLRRAIAHSYSPRNSTDIFDAAHRREEEAWKKLMTLLLDPLIYPVCILDALRTGIMLHFHRGIRQGTIEARPHQFSDLRFAAKYNNSHETVLLHAYRLLKLATR